MSFTIKEVSPKLFQVNWSIELDRSMSNKTHAFHLDSSSWLYVLDCYCAANEYASHHDWFNNCKIILRLEKLDAGNSVTAQNRLKRNEVSVSQVQDHSCNVGLKGEVLDYPICVWATLDDEEIHALTFRRADLWESELFQAKMGKTIRPSYQQIKRKLDIRLWLKFEDPKGGKLQALEDFVKLFINQIRCDVHFRLAAGKLIGAHLIILCARSPVFEAMFQHDSMKESETRMIQVEDVESPILQEFLHYLYAGTTSKPLNDRTAQPLYEISNKYDVASLREECIAFLLSSIRVDNAINLLAWSHLYSIPRVKQAALKFVSLNGKEICNLPEWEAFAKNYPEVSVDATRKMLDHLAPVTN